ncbi:MULTISPECIES: hypothetical protein [Trueperella]|uniref:hypothetical protein n=1 Tax=Trueperella TaxID=1069494 RepID=UPI0008C1C6A5|nr:MULTISPECIES: hypothetical protein [Trueperella]MCM3906874.1 hypothetical protein [Trueperella bernardiae]OFS73874.1 hypothetical protein HMPREF3167_06205 [Trueperella sp. HMSC08B05]
MGLSTKREIALEGIENLQRATEIALSVEDRASSTEVRELARAIRFASFGAQQIGLALTDRARVNDL